MSDEFCNKCQIYENETLGRYVKANDVIHAGETILLEKPLLILPCTGEKRCCNCFRFALQYCSKCSISPMCLECQTHSEYDCSTLMRLTSLPDVKLDLLKKHLDTYGLLRCLLLQENPETREHFERMLNMESHLEKRRNTPIWQQHNKEIIQPLIKSNILKGLQMAESINEDLLQKICSIWDVNSHEIRAPDTAAMRGLYVNVSLLAHHCCPNANQAIDDQYRMKVYANRDIGKDEMVTNSYTNLLLGTEERREFLREGKYFHCTCERCEDPTELGTHMSSFVCAPCAGKNQEGFIVKDAASKSWKCLKCGHTLRNAQVQNILEKAREEVFHSQDDLRRLEYLLAKLHTILHKNHYIIVDLKQNIANILRSIIMSSLQRPGRRLYERKIRLCQDLVLLLHTIQPGISRLKGIALYEMATASAELYRLRFGEKELSVQELKEHLGKCESMFKEAIRLLLHEPSETPEGKLVKSMMNELKDLRNDIQLLDQPAPEAVEDEEENAVEAEDEE
ncbi:SET domain-containing protein SmydA-8 [Stomoxys calcitrans]|uniref:SET domain-containing protein n=2 Tax=Stomoxys calcitrans TaxID=35570 RepID=A0A1I8NSV7_STOCA|nr:SET domain-containing protein SmydA-8 [Stomoxys calcitrans]